MSALEGHQGCSEGNGIRVVRLQSEFITELLGLKKTCQSNIRSPIHAG